MGVKEILNTSEVIFKKKLFRNENKVGVLLIAKPLKAKDYWEGSLCSQNKFNETVKRQI